MTDNNTTAHGSRDDQAGTATQAFHDAREKASSAYAASKTSALEAARRAADGLDTNPLAILAGGIAIGALAGALIPRSAKEKALLAPVGRRLGETARQAIAAAKDAGRRELDGAGLTADAARDRGRSLLDGVGKALSSAGTAAAQAAKGGSTDGSAKADTAPRKDEFNTPVQA